MPRIWLDEELAKTLGERIAEANIRTDEEKIAVLDFMHAIREFIEDELMEGVKAYYDKEKGQLVATEPIPFVAIAFVKDNLQ